MSDHIPTADQVTAYLTGRGWTDYRPDRGHVWTVPDGTTCVLNPRWVEDERYRLLMYESIADVHRTSMLNIALELEGRPRVDADLDAIGTVLAVWRMARHHPEAFEELKSDRYFPPVTELPADARGPLLAGLRGDLDTVAEACLPRSGHAARPRPRAEAWERELIVEPWFDRWPQFMRERIIKALVEQERSLIAELLDEHTDYLRGHIPRWEWQPDTGTAVAEAGIHDRPPAPDIDAMLADTRRQLQPRQIEAAVAYRWISDLPYREHPDAQALLEQHQDGSAGLSDAAVDAVAALARQADGTASPADMGARHLAWESELSEQAWFTRWPTLIRNRIIDRIVDAETDLVNDQLETQFDPIGLGHATDWAWDPRTARVREHDGALAPPTAAATDKILTAVRPQLHPRQVEASVALGWIANAADDPALPADLQVAAVDFFGDTSLRALGPWRRRELTDPIAENILDLLERTYPPGATVPGPFYQPAETPPTATAELAFPRTAPTATPAAEDETAPGPVAAEEGPVR